MGDMADLYADLYAGLYEPELEEYTCRCCGENPLYYEEGKLVDDEGNLHICSPQDMLEHARAKASWGEI